MKDLLSENLLFKLISSSRLAITAGAIWALYSLDAAAPLWQPLSIAGCALAYIVSETTLKLFHIAPDDPGAVEAPKA